MRVNYSFVFLDIITGVTRRKGHYLVDTEVLLQMKRRETPIRIGRQHYPYAT